MAASQQGVCAASLCGVLSFGLSLSACHEDPVVEQCPIKWCEADPMPHCIDPDRVCADDEDCPQGTVCQVLERVCRVPLGTENYRSALTEGFDVPEFPSAALHDIKDPTTNEVVGRVLDWRAPSSSRVVTCAAFSCPPVIRERADGRKDIANYDRCVIGRMWTSERDGSYDPRDPSRAYEPDPTVLAPGCPVPVDDDFPGLVSTLLVGCWAYDDGRLIAATKLFELGFDEVWDAREQLARGSETPCLPPPPDSDLQDNQVPTSEDWGRSCRFVQGEFTTFGTCDAMGECKLRCLDDRDCKEQCKLVLATEKVDSAACEPAKDGRLVSLCESCP